jgi:hypothetical protein
VRPVVADQPRVERWVQGPLHVCVLTTAGRLGHHHRNPETEHALIDGATAAGGLLLALLKSLASWHVACVLVAQRRGAFRCSARWAYCPGVLCQIRYGAGYWNCLVWGIELT